MNERQTHSAIADEDPVSDMIGYRVGSSRRKRFIQLSKQANYQKPAHLMKALIDRLGEIAGDQQFDIRDLDLNEASQANSA